MKYTRAELLDRISSQEISEWMAFSTLEPFGYEAEMLGHAVTASTVANVNVPKGKRQFKISEFIPKFEDEPQSAEQMMQFAQLMTVAMGGEDKRGG